MIKQKKTWNKRSKVLVEILRDRLKEIRPERVKSLNDYLDQDNNPTDDVRRSAGVYVIFREKKPLYVGSAGINHTLWCRIRDLFYWHRPYKGNRYNHTLSNKMYEAFNSKDKVENYLKSCKIVIFPEDDDTNAKALEYFLITILRPICNSEINKKKDCIYFLKSELS